MNTSCKKSNDEPATPPSVAQMALGKWKIYRMVESAYSPANTLISQNIELGQPGDSLVFKTDNKLYSYVGGSLEETLNYSILNDSTLLIDRMNFKINKINTAEFNIQLTEIIPGAGREEVLYELKK
jgi:hypothetical protein